MLILTNQVVETGQRLEATANVEQGRTYSAVSQCRFATSRVQYNESGIETDVAESRVILPEFHEATAGVLR